MDIAELRRKSIPELLALADSLKIPNSSGLRKQDLIYRIEQRMLDGSATLQAEGVLEILPEGYGFLRAMDWNYLAGPDDIYVSPSQIKRFNLRTGDTISGEVRPPKPWERYLALLRLGTINGSEPAPDTGRPSFDSLRPVYPDDRLQLEDGDLSMRIVDLIAPIGKGQRGLITAPPRAG
jgi:transcription termination factor Rho